MRPSQAVCQTPPGMPEPTFAIRGPAITFTGDPFTDGPAALRHETDALIAFSAGRITHFGPASAVRPLLPAEISIEEYGAGHLILPGFIDCHVHYPQLGI